MRAQGTSEDPRLKENDLDQIRFPRAFEQVIDSKNGDPFLPALLLPAMKINETLEIPAPVSGSFSIPFLGFRTSTPLGTKRWHGSNQSPSS